MDAFSKLHKLLEPDLNKNVAKNLILFVGDGMSIGTITAGRIRKGQKRGRNGEEEITNMEAFPNVALSKVIQISVQLL